MASHTADRLLVVLLRLIGGVELLAIPFIFVPVDVMEVVHQRLFGHPLPVAPITEYMARSLSAMYALHGAIVFRLSFDLPRFRPLVPFLGSLHILLGLVVFGTDLAAGLPWWWVAAEGPGIAVGGILLVMLHRAGIRNEPGKSAQV